MKESESLKLSKKQTKQKKNKQKKTQKKNVTKQQQQKHLFSKGKIIIHKQAEDFMKADKELDTKRNQLETLERKYKYSHKI